MNEKLIVGIIGCGRIAPKHIAAYKKIPFVKVKWCCDKKEDKAKLCAKELKCNYTTKLNKVINDKEVDIVDICTPSGLHAKHTILAGQKGKHVIVEKPMALTEKDAHMMISKCKGKLFVVKQNRYNKPILKLKAAINQGRFGKIFSATVCVRWSRSKEYYKQDKWRGTKKMDGGVLFNQAAHHVDMIQWLLGPVESVIAVTKTATHYIEVEDLAMVIIKFTSGALGFIEATTCTYPKNLEGSIAVFGENGSVKVGGTSMNKMEIWEFKDYRGIDDTIMKSSENPSDVYGFGHLEFLKNAIGAIRNDKRGLVDGLEGLKTVRLIQAILKSARTHKEVFL